MRGATVCTGIGAAEQAMPDVDWVFGSEIEPFPIAVMAERHPEIPNWGDMTKFAEWPDANVDLLVGGTPCQSFSVAGLRKGLADPRGNLALTFLAIAAKYAPRWILWENVPGVLSSDGGRDFGAFLGGLGQLGYGWAYRVLDAQYFGVAQRRRRVFVVGYAGDWRRAAAVLFERHSLQGHPAPRREKGQSAPTIPSRGTAGGGLGTDFDCDGGLIAHSLRAEGFDASEDGTGRGTPLVAVDGVPERPNGQSASVGCHLGTDSLEGSNPSPIAFTAKDHGADAMDDCSPTLRAGGHSGSHANAGVMPAVCFGAQMSTPHWQHDQADTLQAKNPKALAQGSAVRRLTPRECERLQGFPDDYTLVPYRGKPAADGPRYKALGNSMAVPVMRWIGERIAAVEALSNELRRAA